MFEYHGWATLIDDPHLFHGAADGLSHAALATISEQVAQIDDHLQTADVRIVNGSAHLWLAGYRNHRQDSVIDVYRNVAASAPWSYGTLHVRDDEAEGNEWNRWVVWVTNRGLVTPEPDPFLTPHGEGDGE